MNRLPSLKKWLFLLLAAMMFSGCLYADVQNPRAYRSATPIDIDSKPTDKIVTGESCNHMVLYLVAWGNGGYIEAVNNALAGERLGSILYDVQADMKVKGYLFGVYNRICTVVTGRVAKL